MGCTQVILPVSLFTCRSLASIHLHSHTHVTIPSDRKESDVSDYLGFLDAVNNDHVALTVTVKNLTSRKDDFKWFTKWKQCTQCFSL